MAVFDDCSVLFELRGLPPKEKRRVKAAVTDHGGSLSFVVSRQCSLVVTTDVSNLSSNRLRSIQKYHTPVVGLDYVYRCVERGALLQVDEYKLDTSSALSGPLHRSPFNTPPLAPPQQIGRAQPMECVSGTQREQSPETSGNVLDRFRIYRDSDPDLPSHRSDYQVAKYSIFAKANSNSWCVLELQSCSGEEGRQYHVVRYWKDDIRCEKEAVRDKLVFVSTSEEAVEVFQALRDSLEASGLQEQSSFPPSAREMGSAPLQQLLLEEKLNTGSLSQEVGVFVELLWTEALGCLGNVLRVSVDKLSLNDVSRAEGLLLQAQKKLTEGNHSELMRLLEDFYTLLPHRQSNMFPSSKLISQKLDLCQLIRDVLNASEMTLRSSAPSTVGKYRALRCSIETLPPSSDEFQAVAELLQDRVQVQQIVRVGRGVELQTFRSGLGNVKPLLHSSSPNNFVGILSRGLLLPRVGVEHHGIERTDVGKLGGGIYFSDSLSTSLKYSKPGVTDGSRLLLVCDVALGRCREVYKTDVLLTRAPDGYDSVHGVCRAQSAASEFEDDEYVVYSPDQVRLKYVVQFSVTGDQLKDFSPPTNMSPELCPPLSAEELSFGDDMFESSANPLEEVTAGLLDSSGQQLPLQAVHVKCKLMDLLSQVIIFQKYTNLSSVPIEAKYVFPLGDSAAVCGFEAFIDGKHVVGQVKEKETARKEYKQAIEKGHGAYLMDQDAPDVFTISVGNLPPGATVLIKVTFVSELVVRDGRILFSLPGSVAPWQESAALNQTTQVTVEKVCVADEAAGVREFTLDLSAEMPYEISGLQCLTHKINMKKTDCKAVVSVLPGQMMGPDGFQLSIMLSDVHLPRMWVEKHPDKDSQACMLVFYPDFEVGSSSDAHEVVLLLDTSESMKGESLCLARRIALQILKSLDRSLRLNVILFGTAHTEAFLTVKPLVEVYEEAQRFIKHSSPLGGGTELWRPLRALSLLPPSRGIRNLLLLSDGHIQNTELTLKLLRDNAQHTRLFTCGLSTTANRHMLRALAQSGGGAYEFFDTKTKHNWAEKVACQLKRMASPGCSSVSVKWQQFNPTSPPLQAPKQLHALFNDCHTLVYGFVLHCTQATLRGNLSGQELKTMVSTSELQKTKGTFLHKLTARALIRDYEDGNLDTREAEHEGRKAELKSFIIELSKEFSILSQFTSFVAIEERNSDQPQHGFTDIPKLIAEENVDFLPYISWSSTEDDEDLIEDDSVGFADYESLDFSCASLCSVMSPDYVPQAPPASFMDCVSEAGPQSVLSGPPAPPPPPSFTLSALKAVPQSLFSGPPAPPPPPSYKGFAPHSLLSGPPAPPPPPSFRLPALNGAPHSLLSGPPAPLPPPSFRLPALNGAPHSLLSGPPAPPPPLSFEQCASEVPIQSPFHRHCFSEADLRVPEFGLMGSSADLDVSFLHEDVKPDSSRSSVIVRSYPSVMSNQVHSALDSVPEPEESLSEYAEGVSHMATPAVEKCSRKKGRALSSRSYSGSLSFREREILPETSAPPHLDHQPKPDFSIPLVGQAVQTVKLDSGVFSVQASLPPDDLGSKESLPGPAPAVLSQMVVESKEVMFQQRFAGINRLPAFGSAKRFSSSFHSQVVPGSSRSSSLASTHDAPVRSTVGPEMAAQFHDRRNTLSYLTAPCRKSQRFRMPNEGVRDISRSSASLPHSEPTADSSAPQLAFRARPCHRRLGARPQIFQHCQSAALNAAGSPEALKLKWTKIFQMQHSEGYWELTTDLGALINVNVDLFANVFLKNKGIHSLGVKAREDILRLVATLLLLQLMKVEKVEEGKLLRTLFRLDEAFESRPERWEQVKKAVDWVCWADRQYPCVYSRLEFGLSWESATRQLLGFESLPPFSPLNGLALQRTTAPVLVQ